MTREDFYHWMLVNGCTIEPLPEATKGNVLKIKSPRSSSYIYYNTPIDGRPVKCYSVCHLCHQLYIDVPDECKPLEPLAKNIKAEHYPDKR